MFQGRMTSFFSQIKVIPDFFPAQGPLNDRTLYSHGTRERARIKYDKYNNTEHRGTVINLA